MRLVKVKLFYDQNDNGTQRFVAYSFVIEWLRAIGEATQTDTCSFSFAYCKHKRADIKAALAGGQANFEASI